MFEFLTGIISLVVGFFTGRFFKKDSAVGGFQPSPGLSSESDSVVGAVTGIVKADGGGNISAAVAGTDYQSALSKASGAEVDTGTDDAKYVTSKAMKDSGYLSSMADVTTATDSVAGKVELATDAEMTTGTATDRAVTPANAKVELDKKLALTGGTMTGAITLAENASIALDPAGSADGKYTGITFTATAGETVAFGDVVYLKAADSEWYLVDADATATAGAVAIAICVSSGTDGNPVTLMTHGIIRADAGFPALTIGAPVYISTTGTTTNTVTTTAPSATDDVVRVVGYALTADEMLFNPSPDHITIV